MSYLVPCPEPGIHRDVPMEVYQSWDAVGNGMLGHMLKTPAHFRHMLDNGQKQTEPMRLGIAAHMALLEPKKFSALYRPHIAGSRATKAVKESIAQLRGSGFEPLRPEEWLEIHAWQENLRGDAGVMLARAEHRELSIVWDQMVESCRVIRCKARPDAVTYLAADRVCNDLKSARSAIGPAFGRACATYGYHRGRAHYLAGLEAVGLRCEEYVFTVLEKEPPYLVATYRMDQQAIDAGREEWWRLLSAVAECCEAGEWPGYPRDVQIVTVPAWGGHEEPLALTIGEETVEV